jgi:hypothetical protein
LIDWRSQSVDETDPMNPVTFDLERRTRDAVAMIGYTYRGTLTTTLGGVYTDDFYEYPAIGPGTRHRVGGPSATLSWYSAENTRYTGPRRALLLDSQLAYYPQRWSSFLDDITDLGGTLGVTLPLPIGRRHTISAFARGRQLIAPRETGLLQVGGDSAVGFLWRRTNKMEVMFDDTRFPPNLRFVEPLRGYEDYAITSDKVVLAEAAWKYPLIIDRGVAHVLFLPAHYLRQLDLELFGAGAITNGVDKHYAVGAALTLRLQFLRIPTAVTYQIARRLVDDEGLTQFVGFGPAD